MEPDWAVEEKGRLPLELVAIGHVVQEIIFFPGRASELVLGSPAAYSAVAAARLGCRAGIVTRIGREMPASLLDPLQHAGVDLTGLRRIDGESTTTSHLIYDGQGNKTIRYPAKALPIRLQDIPPAYRSARLFYICPMDHDVTLEGIAAIGSLGRLMAVDLGGYGGAHSPPVPRAPGLPKELPRLIPFFAIVKASDEDCRRILGDPDADDESLGRQILDWGALIFVSTRGARGALILAREKRIEIAPYLGKVVDPTGGGDTFMGGFLTSYLRTGDPQFAGSYGAATALCVIEKTGGVQAARMPTDEEVRACMRRPVLAQRKKLTVNQ